MYCKLMKNIEENEKLQIIKTLSKFFSGKSMLTYTTQEGFAIFIDSKKAILLDLNLKIAKGIIYPNYTQGIAMTIIDAVFIRHLLRLRETMLEKLNLEKYPWVLKPCYYIELSSGKKFSLPSLLSKYLSSSKRDTITLSSGLWKFMWYYKITFNLPKGILSIKNDNDLNSMLKSEFLYNDEIVSKGTFLTVT